MPPANAAAGEPDRHGLVVVIAAVAALRHRRAAELAGPDDERVVEHAALLQIGDERHAGAVDLLRLEGDAFLHAAVMIPVLVIELDEAHAALGQATREQAIRGEGTVARLAAVKLERLGPFAANVHQLRHAGLHAERHFILRDARGDLGIVRRAHCAGAFSALMAATSPCWLARDARRIREVEDRIALAAKLHALIATRQEARCSTGGRRWAGSARPCPAR